MTTEIGFALFAGAVLAGVAYFGVTEFLPDVVGSLRSRPDMLRHLGASLTVVVFIVVVSIVLTRFRRAGRPARQDLAGADRADRADRADGPDSAQPSQPGRTKPDS